jgi:hypothetical protein
MVIKPSPMTFTCKYKLHVNVIGGGLITTVCTFVINTYLPGIFLDRTMQLWFENEFLDIIATLRH